jgi:hypothetical protein
VLYDLVLGLDWFFFYRQTLPQASFHLSSGIIHPGLCLFTSPRFISVLINPFYSWSISSCPRSFSYTYGSRSPTVGSRRCCRHFTWYVSPQILVCFMLMNVPVHGRSCICDEPSACCCPSTSGCIPSAIPMNKMTSLNLLRDISGFP